MQPQYLSLQGISKTIGRQSVLRDVHLEAAHGQIISILGPSGAGKSTLLRIVAGLEDPDEGEIICDGTTFYSSAQVLRCRVEDRDIGMVFQDFGLWPHMTVLDHVAFPLWSRRRRGLAHWSRQEILEQAMGTLRLFRMEELAKRKPHQLSGGQQQRTAFARAVAARPKLVLLDEAFSGLDPALRTGVREELVDILRQNRMTVLSVTHDQEEAMEISDRILVLHDGEGLQCGSPSQLYEAPADLRVAAFVGRANLLAVAAGPDGAWRLSDGTALPVADHAAAPREGHLVLRPESLHLLESDAETAPTWSGTVTRHQFVLGRHELRVLVPSLGEIAFYHHRPLPVGEVVHLGARLDRPHLVFANSLKEAAE
jgi:ABC-type Fe3+/spermidine/putrescine transport system ATPase subunit